jgi:S-adenosylmethionine decarboxylase
LNALMVHFVLELRDCSPDILSDAEKIKAIMIAAAKKVGLKEKIYPSWNSFNPLGFSGAVVVNKTHLTVHTWPEHYFIAIDIMTPNDTPRRITRSKKAASYLIQKFGSKNPSVIGMERGIPEMLLGK